MINSSSRPSRRSSLLFCLIFTVTMFGIITWQKTLASSSYLVKTGAAESALPSETPPAEMSRTIDREEAIAILREAVANGNFEMMSSAKQMQLQLQAGMTYQKGVLIPGSPLDNREFADELSLERLAHLDVADQVLGGFPNPPVNNPALDATTQRTQSETTIIKGSGNNMVAAYNDSGHFNIPAGNQAFTGYSTSTDGGVSWTDRGAIPDLGIGHFGDPVLARNNTTGRIYQATLAEVTNGMNIYRSDDNGVTWQGPVNGAPGTLSSNGDKEWIAVDNFAGAGQGNLYHAYRDFGASGGMRFSRSTDHGLTFGNVQVIDSGAQGAYVAVGPDHAVYYFWLGSPSNTLKVRRSTDQGITFGVTTNIRTLNTTAVNGSLNAVGGYRTNAFISAVVNPTSGHIYAVHNDIVGADHGDIFFQHSTDGGSTWSARQRVNTDATTRMQAFPAISVTPNGTRFAITWYDNRNSATDTVFERWGRIGNAAAAVPTFTDDFPVSDTASTPIFGQDPVVNSSYMGDYDSMEGDNNFFYTTFVDTRLGASAGQDVRSARIPVPASSFTLAVPPGSQEGCSTTNSVINVAVGSLFGFSNPVTLSAIGNPGSASFVPTVVTPPNNSVLTITGAAAGTYDFNISGTASGSPQLQIPVNLIVRSAAPAAGPTLTAPPNGGGGVVLQPTFTWSAVAGAGRYDIQVASDPSFVNVVASATDLITTSWASNVVLNSNTNYFWRVRAKNGCGTGPFSVISTFTTACLPTEFTNSSTITINDAAAASPYPSNITVSNMNGTVTKITVRINGWNHTFPDDVDVLLVGPTGVKFLVMSDVIGGTDVTGQTYTFDDDAAVVFPLGSPPVTGSVFRPTNYDTTSDVFPAPAPAAPYLSPAPAGVATFASAFGGTNPNGTWGLYVRDDVGQDFGSISGGWTLGVQTTGGCNSPVVSGAVTYQNALTPPVVVPSVILTAPGAPSVYGLTNTSGNYSMTGFAPSTAYTVTPSRSTMVPGANNGIFANDASLVARHVVNLTTLNANQQLAAAVSGGGVLTSLDAAFIARWIVGLGGGTNQTGQWKFTPTNRAYANVNSDQTGQNYTAILMGDVSGDWVSSPFRPAISLPWDSIMVSAPELEASAGEKITIPLRLDNLGTTAVASYQFDIEFDPRVISPQPVAADLAGTVGSGLSVVSHSPVPGLLKVVVYGAQPAVGDGVYVDLKFIATAGRRVSTPVNITNFRLNDGQTHVTAVAGRVNIR